MICEYQAVCTKCVRVTRFFYLKFLILLKNFVDCVEHYIFMWYNAIYIIKLVCLNGVFSILTYMHIFETVYVLNLHKENSESVF